MKHNGLTLGVLGGMGPAATAEFLRLLAVKAPADCDQEHPRMIVYSHTVTPDRTTYLLGKGPDPEPYLKAWERSGFKKEECMVVENAPLGVRAAKAAGLYCCAVNTGILPDSELWDEHADQVFHSMAELLHWLKD